MRNCDILCVRLFFFSYFDGFWNCMTQNIYNPSMMIWKPCLRHCKIYAILKDACLRHGKIYATLKDACLRHGTCIIYAILDIVLGLEYNNSTVRILKVKVIICLAIFQGFFYDHALTPMSKMDFWITLQKSSPYHDNKQKPTGRSLPQSALSKK